MASEDKPDSEVSGDAPADSGSDAENYSPDALEPQTGQEPAPTQETSADVNLDLVLEVPVNVSLQVGSADIPIRELVKLVEGSVIRARPGVQRSDGCSGQRKTDCARRNRHR